MGKPPHQRIQDRKQWEIDYDAHVAAREAKYGVPFDKLPSALQGYDPTHPSREISRRRNYIVYDRTWLRRHRKEEARKRAGKPRHGWQTERANFLASVEAFRLAEIEARKRLAKITGRGRRADRKAHVHAREQIEADEWREERREL